MSATKPLTLENVNFSDAAEVDVFLEQVVTSGMTWVQSDIAELRAKGLIDGDGKLSKVELPLDMQEGSDRDFGG